MNDNVPVRIYGEQLVQKISNLLPRCKDMFVRAKLRNGQESEEAYVYSF